MSNQRSPLSPEDEIARKRCERFLARAQEIDPRDIITCRSDMKLAVHNVARGVEAVLEHENTIRVELPKVEIDRVREIVELAKAVEFAARQVDRQVPPPKETRRLVARGRELRQILLTAAESLATVGIFSPRSSPRFERAMVTSMPQGIAWSWPLCSRSTRPPSAGRPSSTRRW